MYRISEIIARRNNAKILVNGESIGQVASQTLTSMNAINEVVKIPVIRPVACFDKLEIINLAKNIKTYDTSILPYEDCCTIFVPDHPVINPDSKLCQEYEKLIPYEDLIYKAIKEHEVIKITNEDKNDYEDIL
jgi:thiamine biosynthesis protein ThiI